MEMTAEGRQARSAYKKAWDAEHRAENIRYQCNYWNKKAEELKLNEAPAPATTGLFI